MASPETNTGQAEATTSEVGGMSPQQALLFSENIQDPEEKKTLPPFRLLNWIDDILVSDEDSQHSEADEEIMTSNIRPQSYGLVHWWCLKKEKVAHQMTVKEVCHQLAKWTIYEASSTPSARPTS